MSYNVTNASNALQTAVTAFANSTTTANATAFVTMLNDSPLAVTQLNSAFDSGGLSGNAFQLAQPGQLTNAGAQYSPQSKSILLDGTELSAAAANGLTPPDAGTFIFQFGHEIWHASRRAYAPAVGAAQRETMMKPRSLAQ